MKLSTLIVLLVFFVVACEKDPRPSLPSIPSASTTSPPVAVAYYSAKIKGEVSFPGGAPIVSRGICWSTTTGPTITNNKKEDAGGLGSFTCDLTGLTPGTLYYVRAYATNVAGTDYGNQIAFTTLSLPVVTTNSTVTSITTTSAISGGNVSSAGSSTIAARGVCWSTSPDPTDALTTKTVVAGTTGSFTSTITGLSPMTNYYVRAYARNGGGTNYGANIPFRTN